MELCRKSVTGIPYQFARGVSGVRLVGLECVMGL
jgi:hypothetical protein